MQMLIAIREMMDLQRFEQSIEPFQTGRAWSG